MQLAVTVHICSISFKLKAHIKHHLKHLTEPIDVILKGLGFILFSVQ